MLRDQERGIREGIVRNEKDQKVNLQKILREGSCTWTV